MAPSWSAATAADAPNYISRERAETASVIVATDRLVEGLPLHRASKHPGGSPFLKLYNLSRH